MAMRLAAKPLTIFIVKDGYHRGDQWNADPDCKMPNHFVRP